MLELIRSQRHTCRAWLADLSTAQPAEMDEWIVFSFRLDRVQGILAWLDRCEREL